MIVYKNKTRRKMLLVAACVLLAASCLGMAWHQQAKSQPVVQTVHMGTSLANGKCETITILAISQAYPLVAPATGFSTVTIVNNGTTALYFNPFGTTATIGALGVSTDSFAIPSGSAYTFEALPNIKQFAVIGAGAPSGTFSYMAH